jgi:hypothetical protein
VWSNALEAVLSLLLAVILILGAALWWQTGAWLLTEPGRRGNRWLAQMLQRLSAREWQARGREPDRLTRIQMDHAVADAEALSTVRFTLFRWAGGLAMLAVAGWFIGHAAAVESTHSRGVTLAYLAAIGAGALLALSSVAMWRIYPWWYRHNPVMRKLNQFIAARGVWPRVPIAERAAKRWPGRHDEFLGLERERSHKEVAEEKRALWWLGRAQFAATPAVVGTVLTAIAITKLVS